MVAVHGDCPNFRGVDNVALEDKLCRRENGTVPFGRKGTGTFFGHDASSLRGGQTGRKMSQSPAAWNGYAKCLWNRLATVPLRPHRENWERPHEQLRHGLVDAHALCYLQTRHPQGCEEPVVGLTGQPVCLAARFMADWQASPTAIVAGGSFQRPTRMITKKQFASVQDHSILGTYCPRSDVKKFCEEVLEYGFAAVYVNPCDVSYAKSILGDRAGVGTVIGFPQGATTTRTKIFEALEAIDNGATELDVVINVSRLKDGDTAYVENELTQFVKAVKGKNRTCS